MIRSLVLAALLATSIGGVAMARPHHHMHCHMHHHHRVCW
jgi:hypothetical protein